MKWLLATLLYLLTYSLAHAQAWPRNPQSGKIEMRGSLPWPAAAKTDAQRKALVRRWYLSKLTDSSPVEVRAQAATNKANGLLTYAGLPKAAVISYGSGEGEYLLSYFVQLSPTSTALTYTVNSFSFDKASEVESHTEPTPLEQLLPKVTPNEQAALATLRKRLAVALARW